MSTILNVGNIDLYK